MLIFNNKADLKAHLSNSREANSTIGFVPTMGALHKGHLSLLEQSVKENQVTVISIFVNPTQFNNPEDLEKYPRTLEEDVKKIQSVNENIIVFAPTVEDMYEDNTQTASFDFDGLENQMEGSHRPGHFNGVGTIVKKLFEAIAPDNAYFGEKDFQQLQIVKKLVEKYNIPVKITGCPITRETNGLAMSSRNQRLSENEKEKASIIYQSLNEARNIYTNTGIKAAKAFIQDVFEKQDGFQLEYFEITDEETLIPALEKENKKQRAFIAVYLNGVRLIDNISLN